MLIFHSTLRLLPAAISMVACLYSQPLKAQVTLQFQGAEPGDTWTYTSTGADATASANALAAPNIASGTASLVVGGNTAGGSCIDGGSGNGPNTARTFTFTNVNITSSNSFTRTLTFKWGNRFPVCSGTGWDAGENLVFTAYHDGVAQPSVTLATGFNNATFSIQTNQYTWNIPPCVDFFYFRVSVTTNRRDELLFIDNVKLTTPSLNPPVLQPSAITGNLVVCAGTTETYSVIQTPGIIYTWSGLPAGASFASANGTTGAYTININWGTAASGTYPLSVTPTDQCGDITGPAQTVNVVVNAPTAAAIAADGPLVFCEGDSVRLSANTASGISWSTGETDSTITVLDAGTYTLTVTGSCGTATASETIVVNPSTTASITPSGPTTFCAGDSVTLSSAAASGNSWSTGETGTTITINTAGTYTLTVTDGCGSATDSETIVVNPLPIASITPSGLTTFCAGDSVVLTSSASSGNSWSTGETSASITADTAGTYTLTVTNGCGTVTDSETIVVNPLPVASITPSGPTTFCPGGSVTLSSSATTGNAWSTSDTTASINATSTGIYTLNVTNGCGTATDSETITVSPVPVASISPSGPTSFCAGGTVTLTSSASTGNSWSTGSTASSITVGTAGTYTLTVTDVCGTATDSETVVVFPATTASITASGPTTFCAGGLVTLSSSATSGNSWSTGATTSSINVTSTGVYTLTVTDGCGTANASTSVTVNPLPTATITGSGTNLCPGDSMLLTASGGSTYTWSNGATTPAIYGFAPATYTVTATNGCGSITSAPYVLSPLNDPLAQIIGAGILCPGQSLTLSGSGGSSYVWSTGQTSASISVSTAGSYVLTAINACGTDTALVNIMLDNITALFTASTLTGMTPLTVDFTNLSSASASVFAWDFGNSNTSNAFSPSTIYNDGGTYAVTLVATTAAGCSDSHTLTIVVNENPSFLQIPNIFSPNGDQVNDLFMVESGFLESFSATVFNRWGKEIKQWNDAQAGWDGTDENGNPATEGTYFYVITATGTDAKAYQENGSVTLVR